MEENYTRTGKNMFWSVKNAGKVLKILSQYMF